MWKVLLTALVTASACFAITAMTGFASARKVVHLHPGDIADMPALKIDCQLPVSSTPQAACGERLLKGAYYVEFLPKLILVEQVTDSHANVKTVFSVTRRYP